MEQIDKFSFSTTGMKPKTNYCSKHKLTMRYRDVHPIKDNFMITKETSLFGWSETKQKQGHLFYFTRRSPY